MQSRSKAVTNDSSVADAEETPPKTLALPRQPFRSSSFSSLRCLSSSLESGLPRSFLGSSSQSLRRKTTASVERRKNKALSRNKHQPLLPKPLSEPSMLSLEDSLASASDREKSSQQATCRRCITDTDITCVHGMPSKPVPDLLQLFNIFEFNTPERPAARMLVNVTLMGTVQAVRLLVAYNARVQDVIRASLKAYVKEGQLPRHSFNGQVYGLHYSPFCLESIDPTEAICQLGARSFFLYPRMHEPANPQPSKEDRPWWNVLGLLLT